MPSLTSWHARTPTQTLPSRSSIHSEFWLPIRWELCYSAWWSNLTPVFLFSHTFFKMNYVASCHQTRPNTVSKECHHTKDPEHQRAPSTTCHSAQLFMANLTCNFFLIDKKKRRSLEFYEKENHGKSKRNNNLRGKSNAKQRVCVSQKLFLYETKITRTRTRKRGKRLNVIANWDPFSFGCGMHVDAH